MGSAPATPPTLLGCASKWLDYGDREKWMQDMKQGLGLTASIIATMTFQLATNPPGGVMQADPKDFVNIFNDNKKNCSSKLSDFLSSNRTICPGLAVLAFIDEGNNYLAFLVCNTISFIASLSVCLLLVSGIPLSNKFVIWLLSIGMCITITSLFLTYLFAASMVTPTSIWPSVVGNGFGIVMVVWASVAVIVGTFQIVRFLVRVIIKYIYSEQASE